MELMETVARRLQVQRAQVQAVMTLLEEGSTVPFIARYRKERTKGLDEEAIRQIQEMVHAQQKLEQRKAEVLRLIDQQGKLDEEIKADIEKEASGWGVDIISVKVRDIVIPAELQNVMSLEAQADRERNARMTVASVEADLAEMLSGAARIYGDEDAALKLRTMLMQYETVKGSGSAVVTVPTAVSDGFAEGVQREGRGL